MCPVFYLTTLSPGRLEIASNAEESKSVGSMNSIPRPKTEGPSFIQKYESLTGKCFLWEKWLWEFSNMRMSKCQNDIQHVKMVSCSIPMWIWSLWGVRDCLQLSRTFSINMEQEGEAKGIWTALSWHGLPNTSIPPVDTQFSSGWHPDLLK